MPKVRAHNISISLDGYVAGPDQALDRPLGRRGEELHEWLFRTERSDVDDGFIGLGDEGIGATIIGRNMFGPVRGPWDDESWAGWWGDEPPYHHDVFVLTHHPRASIAMAGGTTFHFVTDGVSAALDLAVAAAGELDVRVGGGAATLQQFLAAGLLDELHLVYVPILLGGGERLFDHLDGAPSGFECTELLMGDQTVHVLLTRTG